MRDKAGALGLGRLEEATGEADGVCSGVVPTLNRPRRGPAQVGMEGVQKACGTMSYWKAMRRALTPALKTSTKSSAPTLGGATRTALSIGTCSPLSSRVMLR
jgi:hypothetical protein